MSQDVSSKQTGGKTHKRGHKTSFEMGTGVTSYLDKLEVPNIQKVDTGKANDLDIP